MAARPRLITDIGILFDHLEDYHSDRPHRTKERYGIGGVTAFFSMDASIAAAMVFPGGNVARKRKRRHAAALQGAARELHQFTTLRDRPYA